MGCTQSKIENEESVTRCKERKLHMKAAVTQRNAFAAAHSGYQMSLKNTGAALSDYAAGEVHNSQFTSATADVLPALAAGPDGTQRYDAPLPPPPPLPDFTAPPLQRAATMPEIKIPKPDVKPPVEDTIEEGDEGEEEESVSLRRKSSNRRKVSGGGGVPEEGGLQRTAPMPMKREVTEIPMPQPQQDSTWDYFFFPSVENVPGPSLSEVELPPFSEVKSGRMEEEIERPKRVEDVREGQSEKVMPEPLSEKSVEVEVPPPPPPSQQQQQQEAVAEKAVKKVKVGSAGGASLSEGKKVAKGNFNLLLIFTELDDHFLKASESAHDVSKMLEATRLHYHSNFADNRGHIDHSARVMRVITWNRSFKMKGFLNDDANDDFDSEEHETHATILDKMLAWEKKLYDEVKAGELMKIDYQRKVASLSKQKKRGTNSEALERAKAAVSHLHTRYIVDMQSMDSTVSEINRLRDEQLYPKLVELVDGMATMWETMKFHHEQQARIVTALRSLDISQSPRETTEHHHDRTLQLWAVVQEWHSQFAKLVEHQKEYIKALNIWLKLNLVPIESSLKEKVSSPPRVQNPPILFLLHAWHDLLEKLPDELARTAIYNFAAVVQKIMQYQEEEMKLKEKCAETRKELQRKTQQLEDWYRKYMQRRASEEVESGAEDAYKDAVGERQFAVDTVKKRLEDEEEAYDRQCLQVREKSLTSLKTRLPELFRAMSDFSGACSDMYKELRSIIQYRSSKQSSH